MRGMTSGSGAAPSRIPHSVVKSTVGPKPCSRMRACFALNLQAVRKTRQDVSRSDTLQILCAICAALGMAGCQRSDNAHFALQASRIPADTLAWSVERAETTHHIATSTLETRDATAGNQFVVLDVRVRNPDTQPQVVSEGALVAVGASGQQRFTTPVSMLADEFLTLQVLPPSGSARGKIAYEVPDGLTGEFYWTPGNSSRRIALHPQATPTSSRTLASVDSMPDVRRTPTPAAADAPAPSSIAPKVLEREVPPGREAGSARAPVPARVVARATPATRPPTKKTAPHAGDIVIPAAQEQARRDRCEAMLTRNASADVVRGWPWPSMKSVWMPRSRALAKRSIRHIASHATVTNMVAKLSNTGRRQGC